jgi:antitoxin component of RelBE/YafQ-DinJ toxin-antitoxin module
MRVKKLLVLVSDDALSLRLYKIAERMNMPVSRLARMLIEVGLRTVRDNNGLLFTAHEREIPADLLEGIK